ncbi:Uncharacterised protein [Vibrio cholerae]|uniref:Uncharacterized protein n=1 Tax=Vibrio cholerae TaxID=666 RepID=A0A655NXR8_VIBCL|nr:Uncharacterised protein [Vibrio cholerae]CRZ83828.1 Uncharacterised protein [Vibrio cholerae]
MIKGVKLKATTIPNTLPTTLPRTPENTPCQTKIRLIKPSVAPIVRNIAISPARSFTAIIRVETMLKLATPITSTITKYIMVRTN